MAVEGQRRIVGQRGGVDGAVREDTLHGLRSPEGAEAKDRVLRTEPVVLVLLARGVGHPALAVQAELVAVDPRLQLHLDPPAAVARALHGERGLVPLVEGPHEGAGLALEVAAGGDGQAPEPRPRTGRRRDGRGQIAGLVPSQVQGLQVRPGPVRPGRQVPQPGHHGHEDRHEQEDEQQDDERGGHGGTGRPGGSRDRVGGSREPPEGRPG